MAYPVLTDVYRGQVIMQGPSGLPEDQYVNNWYFRNDNIAGGQAQAAQSIANVLDAFYGDTHAPALNPVSFFLTGFTTITYKVYDLGETPPRFPVVDPIVAGWSSTAAGVPMPEEVALCLSFKGGPTARQRGRVYIGPFNNSVATNVDGRSRPSPNLEESMMAGAVNVMNTTENVTWLVVSPTGASTVIVTEGWVDDAFDTQRSRGPAASQRRKFDATGTDI